MTDTEIRQLKNELDALKRENAALKRKFGPLLARGFIAITAIKERLRGESRNKWIVETLYVEDPRDPVQASNLLRRNAEILEQELGTRGKKVL